MSSSIHTGGSGFVTTGVDESSTAIGESACDRTLGSSAGLTGLLAAGSCGIALGDSAGDAGWVVIVGMGVTALGSTVGCVTSIVDGAWT